MEPNDLHAPGSYPVTFVAETPVRFERIQLVLRLCVLLAFGLLHVSLGWLFSVLYLLLPTAAAVMISRKGGGAFLAEGAGALGRLIEWVVAFYAYLFFVTDRFPVDRRDAAVQLDMHATGAPTVASALVRLVTSLPHVIVLAILGIVAWLFSVFAAIAILFTEHYPEALRAFQCDVVLWMARVLAYHASIVEPYPPFALGVSSASPPTHSAT